MRVAANINIHVLHVPGEQNFVADTISCVLFDHASSLSPLLTLHTLHQPT